MQLVPVSFSLNELCWVVTLFLLRYCVVTLVLITYLYLEIPNCIAILIINEML